MAHPDVIEFELHRQRRATQRRARIMLAAAVVLALGLLAWRVSKG